MSEIARAESPLDLRFTEAELEERREHITAFITEQYEAAEAEIAVIGLSGGIDSTLTAHLAVEALGTGSVYGLVMPGEVSHEKNMSDAERVASELLDIEYDVVEIRPLVETFLTVDPHLSTEEFDDEALQMTVGNLRARARAVLSYLEANRRSGLVLGTGNRSEAAVGYFTKYGDGAVDCYPLGTLYKQQVRQLARHIGVPDDLASKTASAELWEGQTDEGELRVGYDTLDSVLALHIDGPLSAGATAREIGVDETVVEEVRALFEGSVHKRTAPPSPQ